MPNIQRTPVGKGDHPLVNTETPRSTSESSLNSEDRITRGSLRKHLAFTPAEIVQHDGSVRGKGEAPLRVETTVLDSTYVREEIDDDVERSSDEENASNIRRYEANISQAERTPFRQMMTETITMSQEEIEDQQYLEALESSHSLAKEIIAKRERERRANRRREQGEENFPLSASTRVMNTVMTRSRAESVDGARARHCLASLSSCGTGLGDESGHDTDGDYQSAEELAPYHGKSILTPQPGKISVNDFLPNSMENFKKAC